MSKYSSKKAAYDVRFLTMSNAVIDVERELCAMVCDAIAESQTLRASGGFEGTAAAEACAEAIRDLSNAPVDVSKKDDKQRLITGLQRQIEMMESNAAYLHKLYPELGHHTELLGAAAMTQGWLDSIETEPIINSTTRKK